MKRSIAIIFGGISSEHEVSCVSAANVYDNIDTDKFISYRLGIDKNGVWYLYDGDSGKMRDGSWLDDAQHLKPAFISPCTAHHGFITLDKENFKYTVTYVDAAFPVMHGAGGEDGTMQGLLSIAGIPYVGCDTISSADAMDKAVTKALVAGKVPCIPWITVINSSSLDVVSVIAESEERFGYPVFVKPSSAGSSVGVSKCRDRGELAKGIEEAFKHGKKLLIEKFISGSEIEVAVYGNSDPVASCCGEINPGADFYDYETKYNADTAKYYIPARLSKEMSDSIRASALDVYRILGCEGLSRVDFFAFEGGYYFNEINTIPGFTPISMYPQLMQNSGVSYKDLITGLIDLAVERGS